MSLAAEAVRPLLQGRLGSPYLYAAECESTQLLLREPGLPEGAVAVTEHQTGGRGRLGRRWEEPAKSSVLVSVLLRPPAGRALPELSLVGGLAVAEAVELATELSAQVKWPNDVLLNRRKVAGVLAEAVDGAVILGIGVNVNQGRDELPTARRTPAGSLRTVTGRQHDRAALLASLLARLETAYDAWLEGGLGALAAELLPRDFLRARRVRADGIEGVGAGIDAHGRLVLQTAGEPVLVTSGEVEVVGG